MKGPELRSGTKLKSQLVVAVFRVHIDMSGIAQETIVPRTDLAKIHMFAVIFGANVGMTSAGDWDVRNR